ncbi:MAG: hypothetical protein OEV28_07125, partial [Nitrospirota bacterium]|nr:hypothetical protein [Nitrospirota bacterium]
MKRHSLIIRVIAAILLLPVAVMAGPDRYLGDSAIYTGAGTSYRPKILLVIDNSNKTLDTASGESFNPSTDYSSYGSYSRYGVYVAGQQGNYTLVVDNATSALANVTCTDNNNIVKNTLLASGTYTGAGTVANPNLKLHQGAAQCDTGPNGKSYAIGNFLNYTLKPAPAQIVVGTDGNDYKLKASHTAAADNKPITGANWATYWQANGTTGQGVAWQSGTVYSVGTDSQRKIIYDAVTTVVNGTRFAVNFGAMVYDDTGNKGGKIQYAISDLSNDTTFNAFKATLPGPGSGDGPSVLSSQTARPQAESLLDAGYYFRGQALPVSGGTAMTSPLQYTCEKGYIILLTNGMSNKDDDPDLGNIVGDYDSDGAEAAAYGTGGTHYLDDVAKFLYETDNSSSLAGTQRIVTHTVLAFQASDVLVQRAANGSHGRGSYHNVANAQQLAAALLQIINSILLETDTSFVAPVVPVSPENRTYSGSRVYLGFFKPQSGEPWLGNLKKYGINSSNQVVDKNNVVATNSDGSFKSTAVSYWSSSSDGGTVDSGGSGNLLQTRSTARSIYTYMGTSMALTNSSNAFVTGNAAITTTTLDVADATEKNKLIGFVRGTDTYDDDGDSNVTEKREWMLGDILHSKPLIVNYTSYDFTTANEADCTVNKALIYVGANDGMLHAFRDCDGQEEWTFIPPDSLPRLKHLRDTSHSYFVDSSPIAYIYDADKDGNIESGDKVVIVFGERRGGGSDSSPTGGFYYALDVSDPASPVYMWKLGNSYSPSGTHTDYSEMGETWSEPTIVKMRIGTVDKMVAFVGAGYDNLNEDSRYGATQTYNGTGTVTSTDLGNGAVTSAGTSAAANPKGRGVYAIEIAELNASGVPSFTNSGHKVWGYTHATNSALTFSFASEVSAMDFDYNGYIDRIYIPDTGGNLWKFSVGDTNTSNWTAFKLFASNPGSGGSSDKGRKMFFRPSVVREASYTILYMGSGDREHPLNRNVVDRIYAIKDNAPASTITESSLTDVTLDTLQTTT